MRRTFYFVKTHVSKDISIFRMHFQNDRNHGNSKKHPKIVHNHFHEKTINVLKKENDCSQKRNVFDDCFKSITNVITNSHKKDDYYKFVEVEGAPFVSQL